MGLARYPDARSLPLADVAQLVLECVRSPRTHASSNFQKRACSELLYNIWEVRWKSPALDRLHSNILLIYFEN